MTSPDGAAVPPTANEEDSQVTDTATEVTPATATGCGCCQPPPPPTMHDQVRELEARREAVDRRLRSLGTTRS